GLQLFLFYIETGKDLFRKTQVPSQLKNLSLTPTATAVREERK
ncbi:hypothetical protein HMPREF9526_02934, partial [Enterococcus faecium TX0133B]